MTTIATLTIELAASVARLQTDMQKAVGTVQGATAKMQAAAELAGKALGLIGVGLSLAAFTGFIRKAIDAADAVGKLSNSTGIATRDLAGLQMAYEQSGLSGDTLATSVGKLSKQMAEGSKALEAMGVKARGADGNLRNTKDVLYDVADKFAGYADGAGKAALAQELFGKSGAEMVPLLNGGSQAMKDMQAMAEKLGLTIEQDTADKAAAFNDNLDTLKRGLGGVATRVAAELVPTLSTLSGELLTTMTNSDGLKTAATALATGLRLLYTAGVFVVQAFSSVGKTVGLLFAQIAAALQGDFKGAIAMGSEWSQDMKTDWAGAAKTIDAAWNSAGNAAVEGMSKVGKGAQAQAPNLAALKAAADAAAKAAAEALQQYNTLMGTARERIQLAQQELQAGEPLTAAQKAQAKVMELLDSVKGKLNATQRAAVLQTLAEAAAAEGLVEQQNANIAAAKELVAEEAKRVSTLEGALAGMAEQNQKMREENALIGIGTQAQRAILAARRSSIIEIKKEQLARMQNSEFMSREEILRAEEIRQLEERNAAIIEGYEAQDKAAEFEKSVASFKEIWTSVDNTAHDVFVNIFEGGQDAFTKLRNVLKATLLDLLYQMTVKQWVFNITAAVTGTGGGVAQAAMGALSGGGGALSGLSSLGSVASTLSGIGTAVSTTMTGLTTGATSLGSILAATGSQVATAVTYGTAIGSAQTAMLTAQTAGMGTTGALGAGGAALGAIPVYGWIAMAALAAFAIFSDDGTPSVSTGDVVRTYDAEGKQTSSKSNFGSEQDAGRITDSLYETFAKVQKTIMSTGGATFGFGGYSGNDNENPMSRIIGGGYVSEEFSTNASAMAVEYSRAILGAIQASDMPASVASIFAGLAPSTATVAQVDAAILAAQTYIAAIDQLSGAFNLLPFENVKNLSWAATDALASFAGGIGNLTSQMAGYIKDFYSVSEQRASTVQQITAALNADGVAISAEDVGRATRADFRAYAESQDLTTAEGQKTYAALMKVAGTFASITEQAAQAQRAEGSSSGGGGGGGGAGDSIKSAWKSITDSIWDEVKRIRLLLAGTGAAGYAQAQAKFAIALAQAQAFDQNAAKSLPELSRTMLNLAETNVGSKLELQRIQGRTANSLEALGIKYESEYSLQTSATNANTNALLGLTDALRARLGLPSASTPTTPTPANTSWLAGLNLPSFDVGTNYVPRDMLAMIHEGEEITPRAYNPAAGGRRAGGGDAATAEALRRMADRLDAIEANTRAGAQHGGKLARQVERLMPDGDALQVRETKKIGVPA